MLVNDNIGSDNIGTEHNTGKHTMFANLLERLSEMFPKQNYQSKLEKYLETKNVKCPSDVEHWSKQFERSIDKGIFQ